MENEKTNEEVIEIVTEKKRKKWFEFLKKIMKVRYKKPAIMYLGEKIDEPCLILSNHEGTDAPMSLEIYTDFPMRMWGAHEMNSGLRKMYDYQTKVYFHEKKHWNLFLARCFCLLASPLTNMFYKGLNLISTYKDGRFIITIKESIKTLQRGESVVIFPEKSDNGYLEELEGINKGFVLLLESCLKKGQDVNIVCSYFRKSDKVYIIDKKVKYSELASKYNREEIAQVVLNRINELGKMEFTNEEIENARKEIK